MLDCSNNVRTIYVNALNGNLTYNGKDVPVYGQTPFRTTPQNYVVIGNITETSDNTNHSFGNDVEVVIDIFSEQYRVNDLSVVDNIASQVLNSNSSNPVGTRFGVDLFPYKKSGIYYDYKTKNPFSIYKESTPYLYLTKSSGIEIRGEQNNLINRGISFPINSQLASNYKVSAAQLWFRYDKDFFPADPIELFEINHKQGTVKVYIVANSDSGNRGRIFALNASGTPYEGIAFYLNGSIVREPIANIKEWSVIGISFAVSLLFDSYLGNINLTGPAVFNNIAYYQANSISEVQSSAQRPWLKVLTDTVTTFQWQFWLNSYTWDGVLNLGQTDFYFVNPSDIYKTYTGTNKIIVDDTQGISYNPELIKIYTETEWSTSISTPV
jgi:hypothetical protein